jgi:hypothetical protein
MVNAPTAVVIVLPWRFISMIWVIAPDHELALEFVKG